MDKLKQLLRAMVEATDVEARQVGRFTSSLQSGSPRDMDQLLLLTLPLLALLVLPRCCDAGSKQLEALLLNELLAEWAVAVSSEMPPLLIAATSEGASLGGRSFAASCL